MAGTKRDSEEIPAGPDLGEMLARADAAWLQPLRGQLSAMLGQGRLAHAQLLLGQAGAGQFELGTWLAALLLCDRQGDRACGECAGCRLFLAGTHPDFYRVGLEEDAAVIKVEQIRGLSESFSLKSYRGRSKVAIIDPADAMNINSFNALLKTLEEPADNTYLILTASRSDRLPRTIVSRSARLRLPLPAADTALAWLNRRRKHVGMGAPARARKRRAVPGAALRRGRPGKDRHDDAGSARFCAEWAVRHHRDRSFLEPRPAHGTPVLARILVDRHACAKPPCLVISMAIIVYHGCAIRHANR